MSTKTLTAAALATALLSACSDSTTDPSATLALDEAEFLAIESDALLAGLIGLQFAALEQSALATAADLVLGTAAEPVVTSFDFTRTAPCRAGGQTVVVGSGTRTFDRDTRLMEMDASGTRSIEDCARVRGDVTFSTNGSGRWDAHRRRINGVPDGLQTLDQSGGFTVTASDGRSEECDYELHRSFDPSSGQVTLSGTVCGREIDRVFPHDGNG
ncbi:MAG: hypothetical protein R3E10_18695 [Gemmatimonadota bacterium]